YIAYALAFRGLQFVLEPRERFLKDCGAPLALGYVVALARKVCVEALEHPGRAVSHFLQIQLEQLVELVGADVVAGAAGASPAVVGAAGIGGLEVAAAHGEHGRAAVAALEKTRVYVVVLLLSAVVPGRAALAQGAGRGESAVVDD